MIDAVIEVFLDLSKDSALPGNIRQKASLAAKILSSGENNVAHKKSQVEPLLEEMAGDSSIPPFTRTSILQLEAMVNSL